MNRRWLYFNNHKSYWIDPLSIQSVAVLIGYRLWISFLSLHENRLPWTPYSVIQLQRVQQRCQWLQHCRISCSLWLVIISDLKGASVCSDFDKTSSSKPVFHMQLLYSMKFVQIVLLPKNILNHANHKILMCYHPYIWKKITFRSDIAVRGTLLQPGTILISRSTILIRWLDHPGRCGIGRSTYKKLKGVSNWSLLRWSTHLMFS